MTPGDIPCNARCSWRWCRYWSDGHCMDNCTCERADFDGENNNTNPNKEDNTNEPK